MGRIFIIKKKRKTMLNNKNKGETRISFKRLTWLTIVVLIFLLTISGAFALTVDIPVSQPEMDGMLRFYGVCGSDADNSSTTMGLGVDGYAQCLSDSASTNHSSYMSFNVTPYDGCTINGGTLYVYIDHLEQYPTRRFTWNALYSAHNDLAIDFDQIEDYLDLSDYWFRTKESSTIPTGWGTVGWKSLSINSANISTTGQTDIELRPDQDFYSSMDSGGQKWISWLRTTEYAGTTYDPYLELDYQDCPTSPIVNITSPLNITYEELPIWLNWTSNITTDGESLSSAWYSIDGEDNISFYLGDGDVNTLSPYNCSVGFGLDSCAIGVWEGWYCDSVDFPNSVLVMDCNGDIYGDACGCPENYVCDENVCVELIEVPSNIPPYACNDSLDNDRDGFTDYPDDLNCLGPYDDSEHLSGFYNTTIDDLSEGSHNVTVCINDTNGLQDCETVYFSYYAKQFYGSLLFGGTAIAFLYLIFWLSRHLSAEQYPAKTLYLLISPFILLIALSVLTSVAEWYAAPVSFISGLVSAFQVVLYSSIFLIGYVFFMFVKKTLVVVGANK